MATIMIAQALARMLQARANCVKTENWQWREIWSDRIDRVMKSAPSGGGIDCGTSLIEGASHDNRLVFSCSFHHMNDAGMYDGWTEHQVIVKPSLADGFSVTITGRDRNQIKDYLADVYDLWLRSPYVEQAERERKNEGTA